jgi:hypothetical protein
MAVSPPFDRFSTLKTCRGYVFVGVINKRFLCILFNVSFVYGGQFLFVLFLFWTKVGILHDSNCHILCINLFIKILNILDNNGNHGKYPIRSKFKFFVLLTQLTD